MNSPEDEKNKGNLAFREQDFERAVRHYSTAIEMDVDPGNPLYYTNRAQAYLKLERWDAADADCTSALQLDKTLSKAYWRRATARGQRGASFLQDAISDYNSWLQYASAQGNADSEARQDRLLRISELEAQIRRAAAPPRAARVPVAPAAPAPETIPVPADGPMRPYLEKIYASYAELKQLWKDHEGEIVTAWEQTSVPGLREAKLKALFEDYSKKGYSEFKPSALASGDNLLDFISARATTSPADFAFHMDLVRAQLSRAQSGPTRPAAVARPTPYMIILASRYGVITPVNAARSDEVDQRKKAIDRGDACEREDGEVMLQRQVEYYKVAVKIAKVLIEEGDGEVDEVVVEEYSKMPRNKVYAGRPAYSIERVEEIVRSSRAYAEDHLDFLRDDPGYVAEHIMDRIPTAVPHANHDMIDLLGKEEAMEMFLNAFARQTLWKEVLNVIDIVKTMQPDLGPGKVLTQTYQRKIGLLAKLVEAFINLTFKELTASVEKSFEKEFQAIRAEEEGGDDFYAFLDMMAEISGMDLARDRRPATRRRPRQDPLASMFKTLLKLDPAQKPKQTWEISACLRELADLFDRQPKQKTRLSRRLVEGLGEYNEAIELREMLLDSHRPRFSRDWSDRSSFLTQLGPLWQQLERCWTKAITGSMIGKVIRRKTPESLTLVWTKFEAEVQRQLRDKPDALFDKLLTSKVEHHGTQRLNVGGRPTPAAARANAADDDDDDDGLPALVAGDDDDSSGPPSPYMSDDDDSDMPPALQAESSDDDSDMPPLEAEDSSSESESEEEVAPARRPAPRRVIPRRPPPARAPAPTPPRAPVQRAPRARPAPRPVAPEPAPGPSHTAVAGGPAAPGFGGGLDPTAAARPRPRSPTEGPSPRGPKQKHKTRPENALRRENVVGLEAAQGSSSDWTNTSDGDTTETEGELTADGELIFRVSQRVYDTFDQYLGSSAVRTDVPWTEFLYAMKAIGFEGRKTVGSSWKFHPTGKIANNDSISFHEPHPDSSQRPNQVSWTGKRLKRTYGLTMDLFQIV
ncbi:hypothetical protein RQP46_010483 [Phenoliferia psychrophenolica]